MSYRVRIESFEGPFDLLLYLVNRQKVAITSLSLTEIINQYLDEVRRMGNLDLDVASDFLLVAATLLEMKAASLLPREMPEVEPDETLSPEQAGEALVANLLEYKKFKNAAAMLRLRLQAQQRCHVRPFGPDAEFLHETPDYLQGVTLEALGQLCAGCIARRDVFLLESQHIAARVIPLEDRVRTVLGQVKQEGTTRFSCFITPEHTSHEVVVTFLAVLELFKRGKISVSQEHLFEDITITYKEDMSDEEFAYFDSVLEG